MESGRCFSLLLECSGYGLGRSAGVLMVAVQATAELAARGQRRGRECASCPGPGPPAVCSLSAVLPSPPELHLPQEEGRGVLTTCYCPVGAALGAALRPSRCVREDPRGKEGWPVPVPHVALGDRWVTEPGWRETPGLQRHEPVHTGACVGPSRGAPGSSVLRPALGPPCWSCRDSGSEPWPDARPSQRGDEEGGSEDACTRGAVPGAEERPPCRRCVRGPSPATCPGFGPEPAAGGRGRCGGSWGEGRLSAGPPGTCPQGPPWGSCVLGHQTSRGGRSKHPLSQPRPAVTHGPRRTVLTAHLPPRHPKM